MFSAGILLSAITVFAATVSIPSNFSAVTTQFLQKLILTDGSGATGVVLDWINKKIQSDTICETDWSWCKSISSLFTGTNTDTNLTTWEVNLMESDPVFMATSGDFLRDELWSTWASNSINYMSGNVGIWTNSPNSKLDVNGDVNIKDELYMNWDRVMNLNWNSNILQIGDIDWGWFSTSIFDENNNKILNVIDWNVWIWTNTPTSKLDVDWATKIWWRLSVNSYATIQWVITAWPIDSQININWTSWTISIWWFNWMNAQDWAPLTITAWRWTMSLMWSENTNWGDLIINWWNPANSGNVWNVLLSTNDGMVWIWTTPSTKLDVDWTGKFNNIISDWYLKLGDYATCNSSTRWAMRFQIGNWTASADLIELCVYKDNAYDREIIMEASTCPGWACQIQQNL